MPVETTYTDARARFAEWMDRVVDDRETVIVTRRGSEPVALVAADELASLRETAHLLRSPKNAERLLTALTRALQREGEPEAVDALREEAGLGEEA